MSTNRADSCPVAIPLSRSRRTIRRRILFHIAPSSYSFCVTTSTLLMVGFSIVVWAVLSVESLIDPGGNPDPFAPYSALLPGQPSTVLDQYPCSQEHLPYLFICHVGLESPNFDSILVTTGDGKIMRVEFVVKKLQVVDLVHRWGQPDWVQQSRSHYILHWDVGVVAFAPTGWRFSFQLPVQSFILIEDMYT